MLGRAPWTSLWKKDIKLTSEWQTFTFDIPVDQATDYARVTFSRLAGQPGEFWFADASLTN